MSPTATAIEVATVWITVKDVVGASGSRLAAVLHEGVAMVSGEETEPSVGLGAFIVPVDSDNFTVTEALRQGGDALKPNLDMPAAKVPVGTHVLAIHVSTRLLQ